MNAVNCLDISSGRVQGRSKTWDEILTSHALLQGQILFTSWEVILEAPDAVRSKIIDYFKIPMILASRVCLESNGFSGCEPIIGANGLQAYNYWSRFIVKQTYMTLHPKRSFERHDAGGGRIHDGPKTIPHGWEWYEMGLFVHWTPPHSTTVICFDLPERLQASVQFALDSSLDGIDYKDPYSLFSVLASEIIKLYDTSVWSLRNHICNWEAYRHHEPDYPLLHEIARHAIHVSETLTVALRSIRGLQEQQVEFVSKQSPESHPWNKTQKHFQFQLQILQGLLSRSKSNEARLQNEITLAFHSAAQRDSKTQVRIGEEARKEASAMKAIAVVTITFLPATFVSSIFSMSFFHFDPSEPAYGFSVSPAFWIYWILAIPLSLITLGIWIHWEARIVRRSSISV